jgi:hypothetical protein
MPVIPSDFLTFFAASLTADGALIGLLFVAISIEPEHTFGEDAALERQLAANSAFSGLLNAFLVSMLALIPRLHVGWGIITIAILSLLNVGVHTIDKLRRGQRAYGRSLTYTIGGLAVYGLEILYSIQFIQRPSDVGAVYGLIFVLVAQYGFALVRSWTLLGATERRSIIFVLIDIIRRRRARAQVTAAHSENKSIPPV